MGGPTTLDTTRLATGGCRAARPRLRPSQDASESTAGGVTSASSATAPGPSAAVRSLAARLAACTSASSSAGARSRTGSETSIVASVLVPTASPSPALTGTPAATDRPGTASRASRYLRNAIATTARTTSLSLTPAASFTAFASASDSAPNAVSRLGVSGPLMAVRGASGGSASRPWRPTTPPRERTVPTALRPPDTTSRAMSAGRRSWAADRTAQHARPTRHRRTGRRPARLLGHRVGRQVEQLGDELRTRRAVERAVVHLGDERDPPVGEALHDVQLPQRAAAVEPVRGELADEARRVRAGRRVPRACAWKTWSARSTLSW